MRYDAFSLYQNVSLSVNFVLVLQGQGHVTVNKPVIFRIYIIVNTWPLCSAQILVDGVNPH